MSFISFASDMVIPKGIITLPVTLGLVPHWGACNIILGRSFLATTKKAIFMHYLSVKIPSVEEVITIKGDQPLAGGCY